MAKRLGPELRLRSSCFDCVHLTTERDTCQGDSGHDYFCTQPGVIMDNPDFNKPRYIGSSSLTPKWCPWYPIHIETLVDRKNAESNQK